MSDAGLTPHKPLHRLQLHRALLLCARLHRTQLFRALLLVCLALSGTHTYALEIHYSPTRASELQACDQFAYVGKQTEAQSCYRDLQDHPDVLVRADAAAAVGDVRAANKQFRQAASDSNDPAIKTRWAELYLRTHQVSDAVSLFREALSQNSEYLPAQLGLAEATIRTREGATREQLDRIVLNQPDNVRAMILLARIELELQNLSKARGLLNRVEPLLAQRGIPPLELYALHAGANLLEAKSIEPWADKALAINPSYGDLFAIAAHYYIITYRYREAVTLYQRAVEKDPTLAIAQRDLGINYLRINNIFAARHHVENAFYLDPFDAETVNTLRLLDKLDTMRVSRIDVYDENDPDILLGRVIVRLDKEDIDALEPYVVNLATKAIRTFTKRYDFQLKRPMIVELFHDHDDFGVRTVSTPGIGLLGVTFGYLTAMDSPKARPAGDFHWGSTLWHEIAHVFTIEATNHKLPRWFSEGLSVYEEWNTGPLADRSIPIETLLAISQQQLLPMTELDFGFVRPTYQGQVQVSYMQAGLVCDFIASRWGHRALVAMLGRFAEGVDTGTALRDEIGLEPEAFDKLFNEHIQTRYGELAESLDAFQVTGRQLGRALQAEDWISVEALARSLIRRDPDRAGADNAYEVLAQAQREQGFDDEAVETLLTWHTLGGHNPTGLQQLIRDLRANGRNSEAADVMESLNWVNPYVVEEHEWLGEHYLDVNEPELALREFNALLGLQTDDPAAAYLGKAQAALQFGDEPLARRQVLYALENAPFYRRAQRLLLELNEDKQ